VNNGVMAPGRDGFGAMPRAVLAWAAVILTLCVAILAAVQQGSDGPAVAVSTVANRIGDALQTIATAIPLSYAFAVGMASAVNPCGLALLPTYLGLYLGSTATDRRPWPAQLLRAVLVSGTMTASFVVLFGAAGIVLDVAGALAGPLLPWLSIVAGVLLVLTGGRLVAGEALTASPTERVVDSLGPAANRVGLVGYAAYGMAFAMTSLGCTLPLFLSVVGAGFTQTQVQLAQHLLLYALGMGTVVLVLTVLAAIVGGSVFARVRGAGRILEPLGAVLLLATGGYIVYYWLSAGGLLG
jgi:cytochrome c biogenesis protein CcdA